VNASSFVPSLGKALALQKEEGFDLSLIIGHCGLTIDN
jgi:hypothetical protein